MALFWNHTSVQTLTSLPILASHHTVSTAVIFRTTFTSAFDAKYYCMNTHNEKSWSWGLSRDSELHKAHTRPMTWQVHHPDWVRLWKKRIWQNNVTLNYQQQCKRNLIWGKVKRCSTGRSGYIKWSPRLCCGTATQCELKFISKSTE